MIRAVLFDFDDTLGNREEYAYRFFKDIIEQNSDITDPLEKEAVLQDLMLWDEHGNIRKTHITEMLTEKYGIILPRENFKDYWNGHLWEYTVPFDGAEETLEQLKDRFKLGIITNGPSQAQRNKLEKSGLARFFDENHVIVSGDYGYHKPDTRLFVTAAQRLGVSVNECVFVGDIFTNDVYGALKAGMKAVWIWNGKRPCGLDIPIIHDIKALPEALNCLISGN